MTENLLFQDRDLFNMIFLKMVLHGFPIIKDKIKNRSYYIKPKYFRLIKLKNTTFLNFRRNFHKLLPPRFTRKKKDKVRITKVFLGISTVNCIMSLSKHQQQFWIPFTGD